ncbi:hypothetical protein [Sorangium cellulosum]|uniref:Uncharacterized protein n=1 Tax=Sorangium cellulosum TaxID=56 RepID=A0A150QSH0_SORCE|nr:hypothetical protein [Sorangium cellulosum]KYF70919.1 hypothetical protein BE15_41020 [Sorangium cellulosum]
MELCGWEMIERLREGTRSTACRARRRSDALALELKALKEQHPSQAQRIGWDDGEAAPGVNPTLVH